MQVSRKAVLLLAFTPPLVCVVFFWYFGNPRILYSQRFKLCIPPSALRIWKLHTAPRTVLYRHHSAASIPNRYAVIVESGKVHYDHIRTIPRVFVLRAWLSHMIRQVHAGEVFDVVTASDHLHLLMPVAALRALIKVLDPSLILSFVELEANALVVLIAKRCTVRYPRSHVSH